jgi:tetratricopeptide (TPR) repeat protein
MAALQDYKDQFILLCESGFIAVNQFDEDAALKLFKAAQLLSPDHFLPQIGVGYLHLCKLELRQACDAFDKVLEKDPHNEMAKTFLGIALSFIPKELHNGEKLLHDMALHAQDQHVKTTATTAQEFVEKYIKKAPSPVQAQPQSSKRKKKS